MNQKKLAQFIVTLILVAIGTWQYFCANRRSGSDAASPLSMPIPQAESRDSTTPPQVSRHERGERGDRSAGRVGDFDYYLVSLSWSPSYCLLRPDDQRQCGKGYGFVLHGLWPQKMSGGYPQNCESSEALSDSVVRKTLPFMPSEKLIRHEWIKHGTCSGLSAEAYFSLGDHAFGAIRTPARFERPEAAFAVYFDDVLQDFASANPQFPPDSFTVQCSGNELKAVRVCMSRDAKAQTCGRGVHSQCSSGEIQVPASR